MSTAIDELLLATADVEIQATGKQPSVNIVAYTGGLMSVPGWGPVAIDLDGIDASADQSVSWPTMTLACRESLDMEKQSSPVANCLSKEQ